jgi:predicted RNA-binding Zn ribbon-like protein
MASVEVDGVRVPVLVAGHPAVEVCNTRAAWGEPTPKEYLLSHRHLAVWARHAGLLPQVVESPPDRQGRAVVDRVITVRSALYDIFRGASRDLSVLSAEARRLGIGLSLAPDDPADPDGPLARWDAGDDPEAPLRAVVYAAADLLTSPLARHVAICPGAGCGWAFLDPRGRRRWCIMAVCGNRAKAARFAARSRTS